MVSVSVLFYCFFCFEGCFIISFYCCKKKKKTPLKKIKVLFFLQDVFEFFCCCFCVPVDFVFCFQSLELFFCFSKSSIVVWFYDGFLVFFASPLGFPSGFPRFSRISASFLCFFLRFV